MKKKRDVAKGRRTKSPSTKKKFRPIKFKDSAIGLTFQGEPKEVDIKETAVRICGVNDKDVFLKALEEVSNTMFMSTGGYSADKVNCCVELLSQIDPRDGVEGMLAAQMVGTHNLAMTFLQQAAHADQKNLGITENINRAVKLMRIFTSQMEALNKNRKKATQTVEVKHVHVHEGGQAIVGNISAQGGGGRDEK